MSSRLINTAVSTLAILLAVLLVAMEIRHVRREWDRVKLDGSYVSTPHAAIESSISQ